MKRVAALSQSDCWCAVSRAHTHAEDGSVIFAQPAAQGELVAHVPVHPRNGPLWSDTRPVGSDAHRAESYPWMALYTHPPHPQVNETPASLTSERGKERIEQQKVEIDRLKEVLHDEIAANLAVREKGGAHDDEDMSTFLERLIAERDEFRARAQTPVTKDVVTDEMVRRFLSWRLPKDFHPDAGINFDRSFSDKYPHCWPIGTNLLNDPQARAMLEHVLAVADQLGGGK